VKGGPDSPEPREGEPREGRPASSSTAAGRAGEEAAAAFLEAEGWRIVGRNFRWRGGELDIVAARAGVVAFVEVKAWERLGPEELDRAIGPEKRRKIVETAKIFLSRYREYSSCAVRFDVILMRAGKVRQYYRSAFTGEL
jgi:putative endonuclease